MTKSIFVFLFLGWFLINPLQSSDELDGLSLDYLLSVDVIETITKKPETLFEAPLGVSILQREEIYRSGATSIPEALRLMPGLLVREQTPGVYDIHVRGYDHVSSNTLLPFAQNSLTLVMIDYRIVFNYFSGGTFWETFPVDIQDVHQIELIRGASSALYGPNAVNGVINIVTRKNSDGQNKIYTNLDVGDDSELALRAAYDFSLNEKLMGTASINAQSYQREESRYYSWNQRDYLELDSLRSILNPDEDFGIRNRYPDPDESLSKLGLNTRFQYAASEDRNLDISLGYQESQTQKIGVNNFATTFTTNNSTTYYTNIIARYGQWVAQFNYLAGEQETIGEADWLYDFQVMGFNLEHTWQLGNLSLRPSLSFQVSDYDGLFIGGDQHLEDSALAGLADYRINDKLRLLGAFRLDQYNHPDDIYHSYQLSLSYLPIPTMFYRLSFFKANRSPFMVDNFINVDLKFDDATVVYRGNTELDLMETDSIEASFRFKPTSNFALDVELYYSQLDSFSNLNYHKLLESGNQTEIQYQFQNFDLEGEQIGASVDIELSLNKTWDLRLYGNYQETEFDGENGSRLSPIMNTENNSGPRFFGGLVLDWDSKKKMGLNANVYYMDRQAFEGILERTTLDSKINLNLRATYRPKNNLHLSLNARGLLGDDQVEYGFADPIGEQYYLNLQFSL